MTETSQLDSETISAAEQPKIDKIGFDSFLDDIFGMNIKGLKTIWALFVRPADYFKAAKTPEWMNRYTPSFRVWFGLTALTAAMKFLWAGEKSPMREGYATSMQQIADQLVLTERPDGKIFDIANFDAGDSADYLLKVLIFVQPFVTIVLMGLLALIYRAWGEKLPYIVRLRYCFAILTTSTAVGFAAAFLMALDIGALYLYLISALSFLMFAMYYVTAYYGSYSHLSRGKRIGYSSAITALLTLVVLLSVTISLVIAIVPTVINSFPAPIMPPAG